MVQLEDSGSGEKRKKSGLGIRHSPRELEVFKNMVESKSEVVNRSGMVVDHKSREVDSLNNEFESLLKECKEEQDLGRKKELRKRLLEVSDRIRELRSQ